MVGVNNTSGSLVLRSDDGNALSSSFMGFEVDGGEKARITSGGNVKINDGDLLIGTSGHGIDFSANSHAGGMTSETLDSYEEGTWTPTFFIGSNQATYATNGQQGRYTKTGRLVYCSFIVDLATKGSGDNASAVSIGGLPFTSTNDSGDRMNGVITYIGAMTGLTSQIILYSTTNSTAISLLDADGTYTRSVKGENVENSSHVRGYCWYHC